MKKLFRVIKVRKEVKAQLKLVGFIKAYNQMNQSSDIDNLVSSLEYHLNSRVELEKMS
jgi:hypothetical protein